MVGLESDFGYDSFGADVPTVTTGPSGTLTGSAIGDKAVALVSLAAVVSIAAIVIGKVSGR